MEVTIKEIYDNLQEGKDVTVLVGYSNDVNNTLYASLYIKTKPCAEWVSSNMGIKMYSCNTPSFITKVSKSCPNIDDCKVISEVRVMALASFANMLSIEAEKVNGVSFTNLYARNVARITDLIQSNILCVCTHNNGSRFLAVNVANVIKPQQVRILFRLLGYTLRNKSERFYTGYVLSKTANN